MPNPWASASSRNRNFDTSFAFFAANLSWLRSFPRPFIGLCCMWGACTVIRWLASPVESCFDNPWLFFSVVLTGAGFTFRMTVVAFASACSSIANSYGIGSMGSCSCWRVVKLCSSLFTQFLCCRDHVKCDSPRKGCTMPTWLCPCGRSSRALLVIAAGHTW